MDKKQNLTTNHDYAAIFSLIPYGTARNIQKRLIAKHGESQAFSISYINMVLDPNNERMNFAILEEALEFIEEVKQKHIIIRKKMKFIKSTIKKKKDGKDI